MVRSTFVLAGQQFDLALLAQRLAVVGFVPLTERSCIHLDNAALDERFGADEFVVGGVVDNVDNAALATDGLRTPRDVASVETESTELFVAAADTDFVNALRANLGHGSLATQLELALLAVVGPFGSGV